MNESRTLAQELGVSERTVRRAVAKGTIRASRPSPRTLHMPVAERNYARRAWPILAALRGSLRTESNVRFALLFGSTARGSFTKESDIDVVVDLVDSSLDRIVALDEKLSTAVGRRIDLLRLDDVETTPWLLAEVIFDGRVLVDRDSLWPGLMRRGTAARRQAGELEATRTRSALEGIDRLLEV